MKPWKNNASPNAQRLLEAIFREGIFRGVTPTQEWTFSPKWLRRSVDANWKRRVGCGPTTLRGAVRELVELDCLRQFGHAKGTRYSIAQAQIRALRQSAGGLQQSPAGGKP